MNARRRLAAAIGSIEGAQDRIREHYTKALGAMTAHVRRVDREEKETARRVQEIVEAGRIEDHAAWDSAAWQDWSPGHRIPDEVRIGHVDGTELAGLPATIPLFKGHPVVFVTDDVEACDHAHAALRNMALRLAAGDRAVLHLIDPFRMGHGFLRERGLPTVAPQGTDAMANLKVARDAAHEDSLVGHDARQHIVLVMDYPRGFSHQGVEILNSIPQLPNAQLVLHHDLRAPEPGLSGLDLHDVLAVEVAPNGAALGAWGRLLTLLDDVAPDGLFQQIHDALVANQPSSTATWAGINPTDPARWWLDSARQQAIARVGADTSGRPIELTFGEDRNGVWLSHLVIGGTTGSGKSMLLHSLITSLATRYGPDELQFLLIDGKDGAEMQAYRELPHAQVVAIHTPKDMASGIILDIHKELTRRNEVLTRHHVSALRDLPATATVRLARLVVVIDEYQVYLDDLTTGVGEVLVDIATRGRGVGIHLVLASQSFHGAGSGLRTTFFDNVQTRVALTMPESSIQLLSEFSSAARSLIQTHCREAGDVVVHSGIGAAPDVAGRVGYLPREELAETVAALGARDPRRPLVLDGNAAPSAARNPALQALTRVTRTTPVDDWASRPEAEGGLGVGNWPSHDLPAAFIVGRSMTIHGSAFAVVRRAARQNVVVLSDDAEVLTGVLQSGLVSLAASCLPGGCQVWVLSQLRGREGASWRGALTERLSGLLARHQHTVRVAIDGAAVVAMVDEAVAELERRRTLSADQQAEQDTLVVVAAGLEACLEFHGVKGRYEDELSETTAQLARLVDEGPLLGIHVVLGATSRDAWEQVWPGRRMDAFNHRFFGQLSAVDSQWLFGDQRATEVEPGGIIQGPRRMGYSDAVSGSRVLFLPYPSGPDLDQALAEVVRS